MGALHFSIDIGLVSALKNVLPLTVFVETGTFEGDTIQEVLPYFEVIHSAELSEEYYHKVEERFKNIAKVRLHLGHSADVLRNLKTELAGKSVLFWLDAHWCLADKTAGGTSQCPLPEELEAIGSLGEQSVILIDDARLFLCPPPYPHEVVHWPSFEEVAGKLSALSACHEMMIANDVIMFFPRAIRESVREYAYRNSIDWLQVLHKSREFDSLETQFRSVQNQLIEKDKEIDRLLAVAEERRGEIQSIKEVAEERSREIQSIKEVAEERSREIQSIKEVAEERSREIQSIKDVAEERSREIQSIKEIAEERSSVIHLINEELENIKKHWAYRLAAKMKKLLRG